MKRDKKRNVKINITNWIIKTGKRESASAYLYPKLIIVTGKVINSVIKDQSP